MSRPAERYTQLLDQLIRPFDLTHDFGRKQAHEATVDYARQHLVDDPHCNDFLKAAAKRLGFAPVSFDTLESRVKLPKNAGSTSGSPTRMKRSPSQGRARGC